MVKLLQSKTMLLLCALLAGVGSAWADTVTFTAGTDTSENKSLTKVVLLSLSVMAYLIEQITIGAIREHQ